MENQTYYDVLGVLRTSSQGEIKNHYRKLVKEFHPDRKPGDKLAEERFKVIVAAYECLSDPRKRATYDKMLDELNRSDFQFQPRDSNQQTWSSEEILGGIFLFGLAAYALTSSPPKKRTVRKKRK